MEKETVKAQPKPKPPHHIHFPRKVFAYAARATHSQAHQRQSDLRFPAYLLHHPQTGTPETGTGLHWAGSDRQAITIIRC